MVTIFAARDQSGVTRYIGDVARGSACDCACLVCGSPLLARQGEELDWHFAHVAGQERPECPAGALNLLRRLALEELAQLGTWLAEPYCVPHPVPGQGRVCWSIAPAGPLQLQPAGAAGQPIALLPLQGGVTARVHVCLGRESPPEPAAPGDALAVLWCPAPDDSPIRCEADARAFVRGSMVLRWIHLPDAMGLMAQAGREAAEWREQRAREAGERWAAQRRAMSERPQAPSGPGLEWAASGQGTTSSEAAVPAAGANPAGASSAGVNVNVDVNVDIWAPGLVPGGAIQYRALDDGTQWVCYPAGAGQYRLRPVPELHDGWEEAFPASAAVRDADNPWLRVVDFNKLLMLFRRHATASHIDSDVAQIATHFTPTR